MSFDKVHSQRLSKLADHLVSNKRGLDRFDFRLCYQETDCGTAGCALGECPILFPKDWVQEKDNTTLRGDRFLAPLEAAMRFFDLSYPEAAHLFMPMLQKPQLYGGTRLKATATPEEVAASIRLFLEFKAKGAK